MDKILKLQVAKPSIIYGLFEVVSWVRHTSGGPAGYYPYVSANVGLTFGLDKCENYQWSGAS